MLWESIDPKKKFLIEVKGDSTSSVRGALMFNPNLFSQFIEQKNYLNDSYTQYKNKIELTTDGKYPKQREKT